jgi:hypothetical protein
MRLIEQAPVFVGSGCALAGMVPLARSLHAETPYAGGGAGGPDLGLAWVLEAGDQDGQDFGSVFLQLGFADAGDAA